MGGVLLVCVLVRLLFGVACRRMALQTLPDEAALRPGDLVLLGACTIRGMVVRLLNSESDYAHVALVAQSPEGDLLLLHADPKQGCMAEPLSAHLARHQVPAVAVLRPEVPPETIRAAVDYARQAAEERRPFNHTFRYGEDKGLYCTELVLQAYQQTGVSLLPEVVRCGAMIRPETLLQSKALTKVMEVTSPRR